MGQSFSCSEDEFESKRPQTPEPIGEETALAMKTLDCNWLKVQNEEEHRTDEYENPLLVLRRGQTFRVQVQFQRPYNKDFDKVMLQFRTGPNPQFLNNTKINCPVVDELVSSEWGMKVDSEDGTTVTFKVNIPAKTIVGKFNVSIKLTTKLEDGTLAKSIDKEPDLYILFNPWSKDDTVYMEDEDKREEYCMNETGIIYRGNTRSIGGKHWNFGQFEKNIMECVLSLLDKDKRYTSNPNKWIEKRADPVWVARIVSCMVNEYVLEGKWSGDYSDGVSPTNWNGSVKILNQFFKTNKMVKYGQCWVFSGVLTTAMRSLGIPTRSITNFASAHDTEGNMTIDKYITETGKEVSLSGDSVWNFHVWNESWMTRPDLPEGYGGWQVIDATPQEVSLNLYQTGPASVEAIKKGEVFVQYETGFVFAEVNSDRIYWVVKKDQYGSYEVIRKAAQYKRSIGKFISTKQVGDDTRHDVTLNYKFPEGSEKEREAFRRAYAFGSKPDHHKGFMMTEEEGDGITINFSSPDVIQNGEDIETKVTLKNDTSKDVTLTVNAVVNAVNYTGTNTAFIKRYRYTDVHLAGNSEITQNCNVLFKDYHGKLDEQRNVKLTVAVKVNETGKVFTDDYQFDLENKDTIVVDMQTRELVVGQTYKVGIDFTNPLSVDMDDISISIEGAGLCYEVTKEITKKLGPSQTLKEVFEITPTKKGRRMLLVDVDSKQVKDLKAYVHVNVTRA